MASDVTEFQQRANAFGLPQDRADAVALTMAKLGIGLNGIDAIPFLLAERSAMVAEDLAKSLDASGRKIVGGVREELEGQMKTLPGHLSRAVSEKASAGIAKAVEKAIEENARHHRRRDNLKLSAVALAGLLTAVVAAGGGYLLRGDHNASTAAQITALMQRSDWGTWSRIITHTDASRALLQSCTTDKVSMVSGARTCDLRVFLDAPIASEGVGSVRISFVEWLYGLSPWILIGFSALVGGVAGRFIKRDRVDYR